MSLNQPITRIDKNVATSYAHVYKSEVLFALSGEMKEEIGQALVNNIDEDTWCSGDTAIFTTSSKILPMFLVYALRCPYLVEQRASLAKGDIIVHISASALRQLKIYVPPVDEQKAIVRKLDMQCEYFNRILDKFTDEIALFSEYRTRLISDVVTGKLDVRNVTIPEYEIVADATSNAGIDEETEEEEA